MRAASWASARERFVELICPPTLAFLGVTLILWAALLAAGQPSGHLLWGSTWVRWDANLYESIAESGYSLMRCTGAPSAWCGNAGWFPGYPVLLAPLYSLGAPHNGSAVAVSWFFDWATLVLLWGGFLREMRPEIRWFALAFAALVPGGIFMRAAFPMSLTNFFLIASLIQSRRSRWGWAALLGACASFTYLTAVAWAPVLAGLVVYRAEFGAGPPRALRAAAAGGSVLLGVMGACLLLWAQTGHLNAYFLVQAKYGHGFHNPFTNLWSLIKPLFKGAAGVSAATGAEGVLTTAYVTALTVAVLRRAILKMATVWELGLLTLMLLLWLVPLTQSNVDYWRGDTLLLSGVLLFGTMRNSSVALLAAGAAAVFPLLAVFYFQGTLS